MTDTDRWYYVYSHSYHALCKLRDKMIRNNRRCDPIRENLSDSNPKKWTYRYHREQVCDAPKPKPADPTEYP